jgi:CheY-like chemotaxis protein
MAIRRRKPTTKSDAHDESGLEDELATLAAVLANYPPGTALSFGAPSRCPGCGDYGLVGHVARDVGRCTNNCRVCRRDWIITRRALRAHREAPARPTPIGRGVLYEALLAEPEEEVAPEPAAPEPVTEAAPASVASTTPASDAPVAPAPAAPVTPEVPTVAVAPSEPVDPVASPAPDVVPAPVAPVVRPEPVVAATPLVDLSSSSDSSVDPGPRADRLQVLVVEDNPFDLTVIEDLLDPYLTSGEVDLTHCATRAEAERVAVSRTFDVVVLDLDLPDSTGIGTLLDWHHVVPSSLPLIALSESVDADLIREARALGASQVIHRPQLDQLAGQGPAGQDRLFKLLRKTAAPAALVMPQPF